MCRRPSLLLAAAFLSSGISFALIHTLAVDEPTLDGIRSSIAERRYEQAVHQCEARLQSEKLPAGEAEELRFLLGHARLLAGDAEGAKAAFEVLIEKYPDSAWYSKARTLDADIARGAGRHAEAAAIYRERVARLIAPERKRGVAKIYRGFAEEYSKKNPPEWKKARTFYDLAAALGLPASEERAVLFEGARCALELKEWGHARRRFAALRKKYGDGPGGDHLYYLAYSESRARSQRSARAHFEDALRLFPDGAHAAECLAGIAKTHGLPQPANEIQLERGVAALRRLLAEYGDSKAALAAAFDIGQSYFHLQRFDEAAREFKSFVARFGEKSPERAGDARIRIGECFARQKRFDEAVASWKVFLASHPFHARWSAVQEAIVTAEYLRAQRFEQEEAYDKAGAAYGEFLASYPLDKRNPHIYYSLGAMELAQKKYLSAITRWERLASKYPKSAEASEALYRIGLAREAELHEFTKAIATYKKCTFGPFAARARARLKVLEDPALSLRVERTFRSDEPLALKLATRNIEKLRVRIYSIDLLTYFLAEQGIGKVESLDIEIIQPTMTLEVKTPRYRRHEEIERDFVLPIAGPGAWVVKVDDGRLESTVLALRSDLRLIVRATRRDMVVYAENARSAKPVAGAELHISNGGKVFLEGRTDARGLWYRRFEKDQRPARLVVFAAAAGAGQAASGLPALASLASAEGLQAKGYLFTDRAAYQPGEKVGFHALIREVETGRYAFDPGRSYQVELVSPGAGVLEQRRVALSEFGSLAAEFELQPTAQLGTYTIRVRKDERSAVYGTSFEVTRYQRQTYRVALELDHAIVLRGEKIKGKARASYFHGGPAPDKAIEVALGDELNAVGKTGADGSFSFEFATADFLEDQAFTLRATLTEEGAATTKNIRVATTGIRVEVSTLRAVYTAGEPFDVVVKIESVLGKPVAQDVRLGHYRLVSHKGTRVERLQGEHQLSTDAHRGEAVEHLCLREGGSYRLRASAKDRFGNLVHAVREIFISGEDDKIKLRILSDSDTLAAGESSSVRLVSRLAPTRALVTKIGDGILDYEVIALARGESPYEFAVGAALAPNFALALAAMDGNSLHSASKSFRVARELRIEASAKKAVQLPGGDAEVALRVLDPTGQPVRAELTVGVVDEAFLALFPGESAPLASFFQGQREVASKVASSCTFSYRGRTRKVAAELVAEEKRLEELKSLEVELRDRARAGGGGGHTYRGPRDGVVPPLVSAGPAGPAAPAGPSTPATRGWKYKEAKRKGKADSPVNRPDRSAGKEGLEAGEEGESSDEFFLGIAAGRDKNRAGLSILAQGQRAQPRSDFRTTAFFGTVVTSAADGRALLRVKMPESTTSWSWKVRGITAGTTAGEGALSTSTRLALETHLKAAAQLVEGDEATFYGRVRNTSGQDLAVEAAISAAGALAGRNTSALKLADGQEREIALAVKAASAGAAKVRVRAAAGGVSDEMEREVLIAPYTSPITAWRAGVARDSRSFELALPAGLRTMDRELRIEVGASTDRALIEMALGAAGDAFRKMHCVEIDLLSRAIARGLAALDALELAASDRSTPPAQVRALSAQAQSALARVSGAQHSDGGFDWIGAGGMVRSGASKIASDPVLSARAFALLARAHKAGLHVSAQVLRKARSYVTKAFSRTSERDVQARLLAALSWEGGASFANLNRLHRGRNALGGIGLGYLALAYLNQGRKELAAEVFDETRKRLQRDRDGAWIPRDLKARSGSVEATALALSALVALRPGDLLVQELGRWLRSRRRGKSFGGDADTEAAVHALAHLERERGASGDRFTLEVRANGRTLGRLSLPGENLEASFTAGSELLAEANRIELVFTGVGSYRFTAELSGMIRGYDRERQNRNVTRASLARHFYPSPQRLRGKVIEPGFSTVSGIEKPWRNETSEVTVGATVQVETTFGTNGQLGYLVLEDPIPAGVQIQPGSIEGPFAHYESTPGGLLVFMAPGRSSGTIRYRLLGLLPGSYRALPPRMWSYTQPELRYYGEESRFKVLPRGAKSQADYRMTPDEYYRLGKAHFDAGEKDAALALLEPYLREFQVRDRYFKEAARMVFLVALEKKDHARTVNWFEALKERYEDLTLSFDQMLEVGDAYVAMKEHERATDIYRGVAEASFLRELGVAGTLEEQGQFLPAVAFLRRLVREYPDLPVVISSAARIAQLVYSRSGSAVLDEEEEPLSKRELLERSAVLAQDYLVNYPESPVADEVAFGIVAARLERDEYKRVIERSHSFAALYPRSAFQDDFLYMEGYARFALGEYERALGTLQRVESEEFPDGKGGKTRGDHRDLATYMIGQIHHARGRLAEAITSYRKVRKLFSDASQAIANLEHREISLPEVTRVAPGDPAVLALQSRNLAKVRIRVFKVDLMRLYLLQKSLDEMTRVKLAGITPVYSRDLEIAGETRFVERKTKLELPLLERGAYLVVAAAGELSSAGMLIRTDLELDVYTEVATGLVRVTVTGTDGKPVPRAHIKVVGSATHQIQSGDTDLRGVAVFENLVGRPTIVVREGEQVAIHRGKETLQPARVRRPAPPQRQQAWGADRFEDFATKGLRKSLRDLNSSRGKELEQLMRQRQSGVEVYRTRTRQ